MQLLTSSQATGYMQPHAGLFIGFLQNEWVVQVMEVRGVQLLTRFFN